MKLPQLLASPVALPSIPRVVAQLLVELEHNEPDLKTMHDSLIQDPVLTAKVLQLVNTAQFQPSRPIGQVSEALALLGLAQIRNLVCSAAMTSAFRQVGGVEMQQFWRCSLDAAKLARSLAGFAKVDASSAFTAGLLHAVGELVMHLGMPAEMAELDVRVPALDPSRAAAELDLLGYSYAQVGAGFSRAWRLPPLLVDALEYQDAPLQVGVCKPLSGIVHLAAWRARIRVMQRGEKDLQQGFPAAVALALGLDIDMVLQRDAIDWTTREEAAVFN
jgi:HD-like signal output (HDOD) protein